MTYDHVRSPSPHAFGLSLFLFIFFLSFLYNPTMPPFRNLLNRKSQPGETEVNDNHLSPDPQSQQRLAPVDSRRSHDREPTEYKLGGTYSATLNK